MVNLEKYFIEILPIHELKTKTMHIENNILKMTGKTYMGTLPV